MGRATEKNLLLIAVLLRQAGYSQNSRVRVLELKDRHNIVLSSLASEIWNQIRDGKRPTWDQIVQACQLKNWQPWPPQNRPELFLFCDLVMADVRPEDLSGLMSELVGLPNISKMPNLARELVSMAFWVMEEKVTEFLRSNFSVLGKAICEFLVDGEELNRRFREGFYYATYETKKEISARLAEISLLTIEELASPDCQMREERIKQLLKSSGCPWIWQVTPELLKLIEQNETWELVPKLLIDWYRSSHEQERYDGLRENFLANYTLREGLEEVIGLLPDESSRQFAALVFQTTNRWGKDTIHEKYRNVCPQIYAQVIEPALQRGKLEVEEILFYLKTVGIEDGRNVLSGWLAHCKTPSSWEFENNKGYRPLIEDYILPEELSAGNLLCYVENTSLFCEMGYVLRPKDVDSPEKVRAMLTGKEYGGIKFPKTSIWKFDSCCQVLFNCGHSQEVVLESLLECQGKNVRWLDEVLLPRCESNPALRQALHQITWAQEQFWAGQSARDFLARHPHLQKDDQESRQQVKLWWETYWKMIPKNQSLADAFLTPEEQRCLFFQNAAGYHRLGEPAQWMCLFGDEKSRERLTEWLGKNLDKISTDELLSWIKCYNLGSNSRLRKQVRQALKSDQKPTVAMALEILRAN